MSDTHTLELNVASRSDTGLTRNENQDRMSRFSSPFGEVFLVTDGMGGHNGGATAAAMVSDGLIRHLTSLNPDTPVDVALSIAAEKTNNEVLHESRAGHGETTGMGATVVLAIFHGDNVVVGHAGDSRAYLYRNSDLRRLTRDHTRGRGKIEAGLLTEDAAFGDPDSSVLTRAFGHSDPLSLDISLPIKLQAGDRILLCSDGLCGYVRDEAIAEVLARGLEPQQTTDRLVQLANNAGGEDNVTVQVIVVGPVGPQPARKAATTLLEIPAQITAVRESSEMPGETPPRPSGKLLILVLALLLVAIGMFAAYQLHSRG